MNTDDIIKWTIPEFPVRRDFSGKSNSYKEKIAELQLIIIYFQKLFAEDILFETPSMDDYQVDGGYSYYMEPLKTIVNDYVESIKKSLFYTLLQWSSFEQVQIDFPDTSWNSHDAKTWDADRKKALIDKDVVCLMNNVQKQMYKIMPAPVLDCFDLQLKRKAVYLFSEKLAEYLKFAEQQKSFVKKYFLREHRQLVKMLPYLEAPIEKGMVRTYMSMKKVYLIGYSVGWKDFNISVSYKSYNWTFFMAWYALEKILQEAEELF